MLNCKKIKIVYIDGADGVGKTNICNILMNKLKKMNYNCEYLSFPVNRDLIDFSNKGDDITYKLFPFINDRLIALNKKIDTLENVDYIISDRSHLSTLFYAFSLFDRFSYLRIINLNKNYSLCPKDLVELCSFTALRMIKYLFPQEFLIYKNNKFKFSFYPIVIRTDHATIELNLQQRANNDINDLNFQQIYAVNKISSLIDFEMIKTYLSREERDFYIYKSFFITRENWENQVRTILRYITQK